MDSYLLSLAYEREHGSTVQDIAAGIVTMLFIIGGSFWLAGFLEVPGQ